jgi:hypothetical protein
VGSPILGLVTAPDNRSGSKAPPPRAPRAAAAQQDNEEEEDVGDQQWKEWVEEYDPGVFLTVRAYPDHPLQLRHVELRYQPAQHKSYIFLLSDIIRFDQVTSVSRKRMMNCFVASQP